ncbi:MAG TPA: alanine racemase [Actinomycetes bacterium]|nr:alanine racemase [Actinomycetes bacterium]
MSPVAWPGLRPAWVEVDLDAVAHNTRTLGAEVAPARVLAVVKADAYGHGAVPVARSAISAGASCLGVALVEEALALRAAGISAPVLVLSEPHPASADACAEHGIAVTVCTPAGVQAFGAAGRRGGRPVAAHLKVDTGMHRQGCDPAALPALAAAALAEPGLEVAGLWSHFAVADEPGQRATTDAQLARYSDALATAAAAGLAPRWRHLANSAGATLRDDARFDLVRLGIELYGLAPSPDLPGEATARLRPALALRAAVSAVRTVEAGERVSYGHRWAAPARTRVATLPVGYADGVRRGLSDRIRVRLGGRDFRQVGRVTMDQVMVDVGDAPVEVGEVATLLGDPARGEPGVREWSVALDTIDYEVTCGLSSRLPRVHHHGDRADGPVTAGPARAGRPVGTAPAGPGGEGVRR